VPRRRLGARLARLLHPSGGREGARARGTPVRRAHVLLGRAGPVTRAPDADADAYFATRPQESQLAAWASAQGEPLASRAALLARYAAAAARFGGLDEAGAPPIPRPPHWGGYRVWAERIELWASRPHRLHDRVSWTRKLTPDGDGYRGGPWRAARVMP